MTNGTSEHEAGDVSHAAALEVAEELERTQKDHAARATIWPQQPKNFPIAGQHTRPQALHFATPSGKFATDVQLIK